MIGGESVLGKCEICGYLLDVELTFIRTKNCYVCGECHKKVYHRHDPQYPVYEFGKFLIS